MVSDVGYNINQEQENPPEDAQTVQEGKEEAYQEGTYRTPNLDDIGYNNLREEISSDFNQDKALAESIRAEGQQIKESELKDDENFMFAANMFYERTQGKKYEGIPEDLVSSTMQDLSWIQDNSVGMAKTIATVGDLSTEEALTLHYLVGKIENTDEDNLNWVKRFGTSVGLDPATWIGFGGPALVAKAGTRTAGMAGLKLALKKHLTPAKVAALEGAVYGGSFMHGEERISEEAGYGYDVANPIVGATVGAALGAGAVKGIEKAGSFIGKAVKEGEEAMAIAAGGGTPPEMQEQFYSQLSNALTETNQKTWNKQQIQGFLKKQGVKEEEMKWSGVQEYLDGLDGNTKVNTQDLLDELNPPQLEKTTLHSGEGKVLSGDEYSAQIQAAERRGDWDTAERLTIEWEDVELQGSLPGGDTKYQKWTVKDVDGTNYREELTTIPKTKSDIDLEKKADELYEQTRAISRERLKAVEEAQANGATKEEIKAIKASFDEKTNVLDKEAVALRNQREQYKSTHWDESNVLYHARKQDVDIDGDKTLLIEEIQSDWHQEGRKKGYKEEGITLEYKAARDDAGMRFSGKPYDELSDDDKMMVDNYLKEYQRDVSEQKGKVPQAPYSKTWHEKAMKDQIAEAVEKGYDRVAWVGGKEQAERYDLSDKISHIDVDTENMDIDGARSVFVTGKDNADTMLFVDKDGLIYEGEYKDKQLDEVLGKEMANKIMGIDKTETLDGEDLAIGGEGMKGFYDKILPKWTNKYIKKYGSKVEVKKLSNGQEVWSFPVTDKMKTDVEGKGQALYSAGAAVGAGAAATQGEDNGTN